MKEIFINLIFQLIERSDKVKYGVYIGSFNPPHNGHKKVINTLITKKIVDKIIIVPSNSYWDKKVEVSAKDRINMLKFFKNKNVIINEKLNNKKYTYEVLDELNKKYSNLYLIIGADNIISFDKWKNVNKILKHHVIVVGRNNIDVNKYLNNFDKSRFIIVDNINYDISSTDIRKKIENYDFESLTSLLDKRIIKYIKDNNLYTLK